MTEKPEYMGHVGNVQEGMHEGTGTTLSPLPTEDKLEKECFAYNICKDVLLDVIMQVFDGMNEVTCVEEDARWKSIKKEGQRFTQLFFVFLMFCALECKPASFTCLEYACNI